MYYNYRSKSLTKLAHRFLDTLSENSPIDPFQKNWIIVQNREMEQWLSLNLAKRKKIAANNEFIFPLEFIWKLYRLKDPELSLHLPSDKIPLQWSIFERLDKDSKFRDTLFGDREQSPKMILQLSKSISDVFDLYQVFRPEMLKKWESGQRVYNDPQEQWQANLWRTLTTSWGKSEGVSTRVEAFVKLREWLQSGEFPFESIPNNIWMFGVPQISKPFSDIIASLSQHINCYNFNFNFAIGANNSDLDLFSDKLLNAAFNSEKVLESTLKRHDTNVDSNIDSELSNNNDSTIVKIQNLLWGEKSQASHTSDSTFSIHSCNSRNREVEVLKDSVLNFLDNNSAAVADDILILVPKLSDYRSQLREVFTSDTDKPTIPINLGFIDYTEFKESSFINLLGLLNSDFKVNAVIDLLDNAVVSAKWQFTNDEIHLIRNWVKELHVHRFLDGDIFSWTNGLKRLFLGFAMETKDFKLLNDTIPYEKVYSSDAVELLGKLSSFIENLKEFSKLTSASFTVAEWISKSKSIVRVFLLDKYDEEYNIRSLIEKLDMLKAQSSVSGFSEVINFETYLLWIKDQFSGSNASSTGFGHGITVSEYVPNRAIPYKFVAILGFNESTFPSTNIRPDFDLINKFPQPGDRISLEEDRHLFFDMIQSAQNAIHFSFLGQDQYTQNKKAPSILLQQLIDVVGSEGIDLKITEHKLHGFDPVYFEDNGLQSFSKRKLAISKNVTEENKYKSVFVEENSSKSIEFDSSEITIRDLVAYYSHSTKYISNNLFGIRDTNDFQDLEDREPFKLSGLDSYLLKEYSVEAYLNGREISELNILTRAQGLLPDGYPGTAELEKNKRIVEQFESVRDAYDFSLSSSVEVEHTYKATTLYGIIDSIFDQHRVVIRLGSLKAKNMLELWINHLALNTEGEYSSTIYFIDKKKGVQDITLTPIQADTEQLDFLMKHFIARMSLSKLGFYPAEVSKAFVETLLKGDDKEKAKAVAVKKWTEGFNIPSEQEDFYNQLVLKDDSFIYTNEFEKASMSIWTPILKVFGDN